jgi:gas vesicle protein
MSKGKIAFGALIGAVAGVVAGVLTAPKAGKETRADLKAKADELKATVGDKAGEVKGRVEEAAHDLTRSQHDEK